MYQLYLSNDPNFVSRGGRVSIIAHSLGSVIVYDILSGGWYGKSAVRFLLYRGKFNLINDLLLQMPIRLNFPVTFSDIFDLPILISFLNFRCQIYFASVLH